MLAVLRKYISPANIYKYNSLPKKNQKIPNIFLKKNEKNFFRLFIIDYQVIKKEIFFRLKQKKSSIQLKLFAR